MGRFLGMRDVPDNYLLITRYQSVRLTHFGFHGMTATAPRVAWIQRIRRSPQ